MSLRKMTPPLSTKRTPMAMNDKTSSIEKDGYIRVEKKSAISLWCAAAVWIVFGIFLPMYMWYHYLICAVISIVVKIAVAKIAPPVVTYEKASVNTGDPELDKRISEIDEVQNVLAQAGLDGICEISETLRSIAKALVSDPKDAERIRRLFTYYLPLTKKLSEKYIQLKNDHIGEDWAQTKAASEIEKAITMIAQAFKKLHDSMYSDDILDISTDIDVLEAMLERDGLN